MIPSSSSYPLSSPTSIQSKEEESSQVIPQSEEGKFKEYFFRKIQAPSNHPLQEWIFKFADKLSCQDSEIRESGMALAQVVLKCSPESKLIEAVRGHLEELLYTENFLNKSFSVDELALNQAQKILRTFTNAIEVTTKPYPLVALNEVPENLKVNPDFIADLF